MPLPHAFPPKVNVLLSTYNGAQFLAEQLDSLFAQNYPNVHIFVRDDGSSDQTIEILRHYQQLSSNMTVEVGHNIGVVASFFRLLQMADDNSTYYAFCDQDDVWLPEKISRAVEVLNECHYSKNSVYFSKLAMVTSDLKPCGFSRKPDQLSFGNALVENVITGATAMFGSNVRKSFLQARPDYMIWHDWWLYLLATNTNTLVYDNNALLLSRRHGNNQTSMRDSNTEHLISKLKVLKRVLRRKRSVDVFQQATYFHKTYLGHINTEYKELLNLMLDINSRSSIVDRLKFVFNRKIRMERFVDNFGLKILIFLGVRV